MKDEKDPPKRVGLMEYDNEELEAMLKVISMAHIKKIL